jgi:HD-like signal output (HDOD) protein
MLLGTDEIRRLATIISLDQHFGRAQTAMRRLWRTAFARALLAERLASSFTVANEAAYTAGLLADIGLYGFLVSFPEMGRLIVEQARTPEAMIQAESREFGVNHCQAGGWLARQWLLPETISVAVTGHHELSTSPEALSVPVYWADRVAASLAFGFLGSALGKADLAHYDHVRRSVGLPAKVLPEDAEELFDWLVRRVPS